MSSSSEWLTELGKAKGSGVVGVFKLWENGELSTRSHTCLSFDDAAKVGCCSAKPDGKHAKQDAIMISGGQFFLFGVDGTRDCAPRAKAYVPVSQFSVFKSSEKVSRIHAAVG